MTTLLDAARQALAVLDKNGHTDEMITAADALCAAIAEAEKIHCRYPECVENEREECLRWISGECAGPGKNNI